MNFFESQDVARRNSGRLVALFAVAVFCIVLGTYAVGLAAKLYSYNFDPMVMSGPFWWFDFELFFVTAFCTVAVIFMGSAFKINQLSSGGSVVAESLGGRKIAGETSDPLERRLVNVVEEMALASGVPVPMIYVMDAEPGINAFAAGHSINDAAVAVTRGCLEQLTRDELQGVIAHEFAHILNGDMKLNLRLIGVLHGILMLHIAGRFIMRAGAGSGRSRNNQGAVPILVIGLALIVLGWVGLIAGRLIKSAVSRQREFLADAAAVQFTRNPEGIGGALRKIGGLSYGSTIQTPGAEAVSHLFFGSSKAKVSSLLATHPPLEERVRRIAGNTGMIAAHQDRQLTSSAGAARAPAMAMAAPGAAMGFAGGGAASQPAGGQYGGVAVADAPPAQSGYTAPQKPVTYQARATDVVDKVGTSSMEHLNYTAQLMQSIPSALRQAAHDSFGAVALIYTLLLDQESAERQKQAKMLLEYCDRDLVRESGRLWPLVATMNPAARLPLVDMAIPALRNMTANQYQDFIVVVRRLIEADGKVVLFEFVLHKLLRHRLDPHYGGNHKPRAQYHSFNALTPDSNMLLSVLAHVGHDNLAEAERSYAKAVERLPPAGRANFTLLPEQDATFDDLENSLDRLAMASQPIKQYLVDACAHCVLGDEQVTAEEADLLRAVCDVLDCPLPPFLPS